VKAANSKNKVYFMWDFILRTFQQLAALVSPQEPRTSPAFIDIVGRSAMAQELMTDTTGQLESMNASVGYSDDGGVEFGDEILELAKELTAKNWCSGCGAAQREDGRQLLICGKCKKDKYCSTECQKKAWKSHKRDCVQAA
jgi:hypothetical protein